MLTRNVNDASRGVLLARRLPAYLLGLALCVLHATASAADADIQVVSVRGDVRITASGTEFAAKAGSTLELPSTLRTGRDGATDLRQGDTTIGIGPGTELNFPAPAMPDAAVERIVQPLGNAFYDVGPRGNRRLRVETPYLVAVIKGTQFNVAVEPDSSTISLYEGSLDVLAPDIGASVPLKAGEIAIRHRGDDAIRVIAMRERGVPAATSKDPAAPGSGPDHADDGVIPDHDAGTGTGSSGPITPIAPIEGTVTIETGLDAGGLAGLRVGLEAGVDAGAGTIDASLTAGVDAGLVSVDAGVDAGVDLGAGTIDAAVDASVDAGVIGVDAGIGAGIDLGAGTVDAGIDLGVDTGVIDADVGVDVGVDASSGTIDVGLDVLGIGIDIGLGGGQPLIDIDTTPQTEGTGGLLDGILRRIGR